MSARTRSIAPNVTVVIPTIGRRLLRTCLLSLSRGNIWPAEVLVVDQSARAEVIEWIDEVAAEGVEVRHIRSSSRGIAKATNLGLSHVETAWIAVTHDDCQVATNWMEVVEAHTRGPDEVVVTGRVEPAGRGTVLTIKTSPIPERYTKPRLNADVLFPLNMTFPIHLLQRVGNFDEHPSLRLAGEDNDWAHRLLRSGVPIVYDPEMVVSHLAGQEVSSLYPTYRRYAYGQGSFYGKHLRRRDSFIALRALRDTVRAPWLLLRGLISRNPSLMAMGRGEIAGLVPGIVAGLRRRPEG